MSGQVAITVRPASVEDAIAIAALHVRSFLAAYSHLPRTRRAAQAGQAARVAIWADRLEGREGRATFVAEAGDRLCGFVHLGPTPDPDDDPGTVGQILSIHVEPDLVERGIGGRLMGRAVAALLERGFGEATLWVVAGNHRARVFYESRGWRSDGGIRREVLGVEGEEGDEVTVVRYRRTLDDEEEEA